VHRLPSRMWAEGHKPQGRHIPALQTRPALNPRAQMRSARDWKPTTTTQTVFGFVSSAWFRFFGSVLYTFERSKHALVRLVPTKPARGRAYSSTIVKVCVPSYEPCRIFKKTPAFHRSHLKRCWMKGCAPAEVRVSGGV